MRSSTASSASYFKSRAFAITGLSVTSAWRLCHTFAQEVCGFGAHLSVHPPPPFLFLSFTLPLSGVSHSHLCPCPFACCQVPELTELLHRGSLAEPLLKKQINYGCADRYIHTLSQRDTKKACTLDLFWRRRVYFSYFLMLRGLVLENESFHYLERTEPLVPNCFLVTN